jgi:hypothetical protein
MRSSAEMEYPDCLTEGHINLGSLLAEIGCGIGGVDLEIGRDKTPAEPISFE